MFKSKTLTNEMTEQEAANLKETLTRLQQDVRDIMFACTHPDATTRELSESALKRLKNLENELKKSIEGKEEVLKRRRSTRRLLRRVFRLFTKAKDDISASTAEKIEQEIITKYKLESEKSRRNFLDSIRQDIMASESFYSSRDVQPKSRNPVTHPQVPGTSSIKTSGKSSDASTSQAQMKTHHTPSGNSKESSHQESSEMPPARDTPRHQEENVPGPSWQRMYSYSSISSSLRAWAPSPDLQGSVNSLEYQEKWEHSPYNSEDDHSSKYDIREVEESMERVSIASRDTFGQPKHAKHSYGGAGNAEVGSF